MNSWNQKMILGYSKCSTSIYRKFRYIGYGSRTNVEGLLTFRLIIHQHFTLASVHTNNSFLTPTF